MMGRILAVVAVVLAVVLDGFVAALFLAVVFVLLDAVLGILENRV